MSKKTEELKAWKKRSDVLKKTTMALEAKIEDLTNRNSELMKYQGSKDDLQKEELELLRAEAKKVNTAWTAKKDVKKQY